MNIDLFAFNKINSFAGKFFWLDTLGIFFAKYFEYFLIFFLLLFLVKNYKPVALLLVITSQLNKKYWPMVIQAFTAAILSRFVIVEIIRYFLPRSRPFVDNLVNLLINYPKEPSFPSGHAAFYFAISTVVYFYNKKAGLLFFLASLLIVISRVFIGIHWPSDILVGALIGIFSGLLIILAFRKFSSTAEK